MTYVLITAALPILGSLALVVLALVNASRARIAERMAQTVGLPIPTDAGTVETLRHFTRARLIAGAIGGAVASLVAVAIVLPVADQFTYTAPYLLIASWIVGLAVGTGIAAFLFVYRSLPPGPRVARASAVTLDNYLSRLDQRLPVVAVVLAVVVTAGAWLRRATARDLPPHGVYFLIPGAVLATLSVLALVMFEIMSRALVSRSQLASTPEQLRWDDALRSQVIRTLVAGPLAASGYTLLVGVPGLQGLGVTGWLTIPAIVATLALAITVIVSLLRQPQRRFIRTLWTAPSR